MSSRTAIGRLSVDSRFADFIEQEALPGSCVSSEVFWRGLESLVERHSDRTRELLGRRDHLQAQLDTFHASAPGTPDPVEYEHYLREIGYLVPSPPDFQIDTRVTAPEITQQAGPQLVVPLSNTRFAINAANARWGSLYDAIYGTDVVADVAPTERKGTYNAERGREVIARTKTFLDDIAPLTGRSHDEVTGYRIDAAGLVADLPSGGSVSLEKPELLIGFAGDKDSPHKIVLRHHGLHVEIAIDRDHAVGRVDRAGVCDVILESAITVIMDLEDSVAAVDAEDKIVAYRSWLGLQNGTLTAQVDKDGRQFTRRMNPDRVYTDLSGDEVLLSGRALMFIRHVGLHMWTDIVLDAAGREIPEGILDAVVTSTCVLPRSGASSTASDRSLFVVKPKLHGPEEVAFTVEMFTDLERLLGLDHGTLKIGIMDEERRTSVNLEACIYAARDRVVFINTGFLDRTGDEIHTSMLAGPVVRKSDLKAASFIRAYEIRNVQTGLKAGFAGRAQIGKGMWAKPNMMAEMLRDKVAHPHAGASTAWVPSPTAATLHALHYHQVDVISRQAALAREEVPGLDELLDLPLADQPDWSQQERKDELDANVQSVLGYVARWVGQGIGCSTVPDLDDIGLMEDRATLRISSQLLANWLHHAVITEAEVIDSLGRVARVVDAQNEGDSTYKKLLADDGPSLGFLAAQSLIFDGREQPNGYTEHILFDARRKQKQVDRSAESRQDDLLISAP